MSDTINTPGERRITLRVPVLLAARVDKSVKERRGEIRKFSLNDWIVEAMREKVDGAVTVAYPGLQKQVSDLEKRMYVDPVESGSVQPGRVGEGFWDNWMRGVQTA